jgi:hypothetical protein
MFSWILNELSPHPCQVCRMPRAFRSTCPGNESDQVMFAMFMICSWCYNDIQWCSCFLLKFVAEILLDAQDSQKVENFRRLSTRTSIEYQYTVYTVYQCLPSQYSGRFWMLMTGCFTSWCTKGGGEAKLWLNPRFPYHGAVSVKTYAWSNWCFSFCSGRQGKIKGLNWIAQSFGDVPPNFRKKI